MNAALKIMFILKKPRIPRISLIVVFRDGIVREICAIGGCVFRFHASRAVDFWLQNKGQRHARMPSWAAAEALGLINIYLTPSLVEHKVQET